MSVSARPSGAGSAPPDATTSPDATASPRPLAVVPFERRVPYREALELQRRLARERISGEWEEDLLLLLEHEPVLTLGRTSGEGHLRVPGERLAELGVETVEIERGGDVTYHGPGQLVGYPILDLSEYREDLHWYVRTLEEALIRALSELGLPAFRVPDHTGVWVGERTDRDSAIADGELRKVASIGVHVSRWVTWHGFALNVTREPLERFRLIVPCGIEGVRMTSLESEGIEASVGRVREAVTGGFAAAFGVRPRRRRPPF